MNLKKKSTYQPQIQELREYINYLDQRIQRYRKAGRPVDHLLQNKASARQTIIELEQAQQGNGMGMP